MLLRRFPRNGWLWLAAILASWHQLEHTYMIAIYLTSGQAGTPGLLAQGGLIAGGLPLKRPDLHFLYNLLETIPLLVAFVVQVRRTHDATAGPRTMPAQPADRVAPVV
jgi:hypothetical protein